MSKEAINILIISVASLSIIGLIAGLILAYAARKFAVKVDPRIEEVVRTLPGANCGACGFASCQAFAEALVQGKTDLALCKLSPETQRKEIARLLGIEEKKVEDKIAVIRCGAGKELCQTRFEYKGVKTCKAENEVMGGSLSCEQGCLAWGDCIDACPFDAIKRSGNNPPIIDKEKCTGCGKCIAACPRGLITLVPRKQKVYILCNTKDKALETRKNCKVGCTGCKLCIKKCPSQAITMEGRIPIIDAEKCVVSEECIKVCPQKTIKKI